MTIGLIFFTLADSTVQPNFNFTGGCGQQSNHSYYTDVHNTGVVLISMALCADAVIGNVQEKTLKQSTISEMVFTLSISQTG